MVPARTSTQPPPVGLLPRLCRWLSDYHVWLARKRDRTIVPLVPAQPFNAAIASLEADGWKNPVSNWIFPPASLQTTSFVLRRSGAVLVCTWDTENGGSFVGPDAVVRGVADRIGYIALEEWRWIDHDEASVAGPRPLTGPPRPDLPAL